ncbi:hypothetical protein COCON_G00235820, partial [Conger conger]
PSLRSDQSTKALQDQCNVKPLHTLRALEGSDVTMSCEVSHLPDSATLAWERDREPTANTTLIYNNTAHIIIHSFDQHSEGTYNCTLRRNGALIFSIPNELKVTKETLGTQHTLYRGSLNSSEAVLICHSLSSYTKASWSWAPVSETQAIPVAYAVKFGDSGRYTCFYERNRMAEINLVTIQVSTEPPGGLSRNQPVVLNCEISQVIGTVTLAWLQMKGGRGELVKQEVLTERSPKTMLKLTLPSLTEDQLHWACVVFTGSLLRAQVPLHLTLPIKQGWSTETVVRVVIVALATLGMLLVLRWYWSWTRRQASEPESAQPEE